MFCVDDKETNDESVIGNGGVSVERRYGCYKFGIIAACLIIIILIIGTVPVFFTVKNSNIVLIITIIILITVGLLLVGYCLWQRHQVTTMKSQREMEYLGRPP